MTILGLRVNPSPRSGAQVFCSLKPRQRQISRCQRWLWYYLHSYVKDDHHLFNDEGQQGYTDDDDDDPGVRHDGQERIGDTEGREEEGGCCSKERVLLHDMLKLYFNTSLLSTESPLCRKVGEIHNHLNFGVAGGNVWLVRFISSRVMKSSFVNVSTWHPIVGGGINSQDYIVKGKIPSWCF